jgi:solute carrier family 25 citrate transporter 1
VGPLVVGSIGKDAVRFLSFDSIKSTFKDRETGRLSPLRSLAAGMASGVVAALTAVTPSERIKTALIDDARGAKRFTGAVDCCRAILAEHGIKGLYRGLAGTMLKQAGATAMRMGTYNVLKDMEKARGVQATTASSFLNGCIAGTVTTLTTQPFDMIKTRCQSAKGASTAEAFVGIMKEYGIKGFWRGTTMRLGRTVMSGGILFTSYEWALAIVAPMMRVVVEKDALLKE